MKTTKKMAPRLNPQVAPRERRMDHNTVSRPKRRKPGTFAAGQTETVEVRGPWRPGAAPSGQLGAGSMSCGAAKDFLSALGHFLATWIVDWKPIAEVPRDGTRLMLWDSVSKRPAFGSWCGDNPAIPHRAAERDSAVRTSREARGMNRLFAGYDQVFNKMARRLFTVLVREIHLFKELFPVHASEHGVLYELLSVLKAPDSVKTCGTCLSHEVAVMLQLKHRIGNRDALNRVVDITARRISIQGEVGSHGLP